MLENGSGRERRVFERMLVRCPVKFKPEEDTMFEGSAKDLSDGGLGLFAHAKLEERMHLEMWVKLSPQIKPLYIAGKVVWTEERRLSLWRAGVSFNEMAFVKVVKILVGKTLN
ncbi:MAG: PilZ domain-containing protein [Candidatus Omnitrophica bacterium]|nr:PilZ domain-containing protein [Candidatus Omnitrophota bacterium]